MITGSKLLIEHGFASKKFSEKYPDFSKLDRKKQREILDNLEKKGMIHEFAEHDTAEIAKDQMLLLEAPKPLSRYFATYETFHSSIEPVYFFSLNLLNDMGFGRVDKITDLFAASQHSSFYGHSAQRLGMAQDKASQFLASIGQFIKKDLFGLIRDLRWIDERINFHEDARKNVEPAEITLKQIWTDMVDGVVQGQRVTSNIFQLAQQAGFQTLPTYFFSIHPKTPEETDRMIDDLDTTKPVKSILKGKLNSYLNWRHHNHIELKERKKFELKYLRQHYNIIKLYMAWLKPYLKNVEMLTPKIRSLESPEIVTAFESSLVEIEVLAVMVPEGNKDYYSCLLLNFQYRTKPQMEFHKEFAHRGPVHTGETKITWRSYAWSEKEIEAYKQVKEKEDMEMIATIDASIKESVEALGDDLWKYLEQAGEAMEKKEELLKKEPERAGLLEPFAAVGRGFADLFRMFLPKKKRPSGAAKLGKEEQTKEQKKAASNAKKLLWGHYKTFKKAHKMLTW